MPFKSGDIPWNKWRRKDKIAICPVCNKEIKTRYDSQVYCNIECYSKSKKLKEFAKNSFLIKNNKNKKWREGTGGKSFVNRTTFKKGDLRISGRNNPKWKGGITKLQQKIRKLSEYKHWRNEIFKRDDWTCKKCCRRGIYLEAHHLKEFNLILKQMKIINIKQARECEELWDIKNGVTICRNCHDKTKYFRIKNAF